MLYEELLVLGETITAKSMISVSMDGGGKWPLVIFATDLLAKLGGPGTSSRVHGAIAAKDFSAPEFQKAAELLRKLHSAASSSWALKLPITAPP